MDPDYDVFEVVKVIHDFWLFDAESYQRRYSIAGSRALAPGYYVVSWPESIRNRRFNEDASFHGPFAFRQEAQKFLVTMQEHNYMLIPYTKSRAA
jgi:hypothetical protein